MGVDGGNGAALEPEVLAPFSVGQADVGCRNRANEPGSLDNFALRVSVGDRAVDVLPGERAVLTVDGDDDDVHALRSASRHSGVEWTDAPYSFMSFAIARLP